MSAPVPYKEIFLAIAVIVIAARLVGILFARIGQPAVVGEIVAGLLLGATALARLPGNPSDNLFPPDTLPYLKAISALGLVLFMFIVGLELDLSIVRGQERLAGTISLSSIALPFGGGLLLGLAMYASHHPPNPGQHKLTFALFIGAAMSITAFPVLARILTDRGMLRTPLGSLSMASAAVDDVVAWTLLAVVVALAGHAKDAGTSQWHAGTEPPWHMWLTIPYLLVMALGVRPVLGSVIARFNKLGRLTPDLLAVVLVGLLGSAFFADWLGVHYIFGAFLFGAVMPRTDAKAMVHQILERLEQVSVLLLLPVFFVVTGLTVDFGNLGPHWVWQLPAILGVATGGKFIGAYTAARLQHVPRPRAGAIGALMNTRGLTEIVILTVGQQKGILDQQLFSLLVLMAVVTTVMTGPLFRLIYSDRRLARDIVEAERAAVGADAYRVLVAVTDLADESPVRVARDLIGAERPCEVVIAHVRPLARPAVEVGSGLSIELAEFAESAERLEALRAAATSAEIEAVTLVRMSDDPSREIAAMGGAIDADIVVLAGAIDRQVVAANVTCIVVAAPAPLEAGEGAPVRLLVDAGADADAATEIAVRLARSRGVELDVAAVDPQRGSRAGAVAAAAGRAGLTATVSGSGRRPAIVVSSVGVADQGGARVDLQVSANQDRDVLAPDQLIRALTGESARRR